MAERAEPETDYTCVLSGPLARKTPLLASLERAGVDLSEPQHLDSHWAVKYAGDVDPTQGWVHCRTTHPDEVSGHVSRAGWRLVAHWPTGTCGECQGTGHVNHGTEGLGTCLHCRGVGRTNVAAKTAEQKLLERIERLEAQLAGRG